MAERPPPRTPALSAQAKLDPPELDAQQTELVRRLRAAGGAPVSFEELREAGIEHPAVIGYELGVVGIEVERVYGVDGKDGQSSPGLRLGERAAFPQDPASAPTEAHVPADHAEHPPLATDRHRNPAAATPPRAAVERTQLLRSLQAIAAAVLVALRSVDYKAPVRGLRNITRAARAAAGARRHARPPARRPEPTQSAWPPAPRDSLAATRAGIRAGALALAAGARRLDRSIHGERLQRVPPAVLAAGAIIGVLLATTAIVLANRSSGPEVRIVRGEPKRTTALETAKTVAGSPAGAGNGAGEQTATTTTSAGSTATGAATTPSPPPATTTEAPAAPAGQATTAQAAPLQLQGHELLAQGRYAPAVATLRTAMAATKASPSSCSVPSGEQCLTYAYALYDLGRALLLNGDPREAVGVLMQRLQIDNQRGVVEQELSLARAALAGGTGTAPHGGPGGHGHGHGHGGPDGAGD